MKKREKSFFISGGIIIIISWWFLNSIIDSAEAVGDAVITEGYNWMPFMISLSIFGVYGIVYYLISLMRKLNK